MKLPNQQSGLDKHIIPLRMNGLTGRMLVLPPKVASNKEILIVYGIHASLERFEGVASYLSRFGRVTMPDLPGIGGMEPFSKIAIKSDFDAYADYLASFIKLRYKGKKITVIGISFGFIVVTRMLQRFPDLQKKIETVVSVVGIGSGVDSNIKGWKHLAIATSLNIAKSKLGSIIIKRLILNRMIMNLIYSPKHAEMNGISEQERNRLVNFELHLWQTNDLKSWGTLMLQMKKLKHPDITIPIKLYHVETANDQWLDHDKVLNSLQRIFSGGVESHVANMNSHGASLLATEEEAAALIPNSLRKKIL